MGVGDNLLRNLCNETADYMMVSALDKWSFREYQSSPHSTPLHRQPLISFKEKGIPKAFIQICVFLRSRKLGNNLWRKWLIALNSNIAGGPKISWEYYGEAGGSGALLYWGPESILKIVHNCRVAKKLSGAENGSKNRNPQTIKSFLGPSNCSRWPFAVITLMSFCH